MSAKETIKRIVDSFNSKPLLRDKTREMGEGLILGAQLADEANERSKSTDAQFDVVQREMSNKDVVSSAEILAATVGTDGTVHPTLKKRLDDEQKKTTAQFQQNEMELAEIDESTKNMYVSINKFPRLIPESNDTGRFTRAFASGFNVILKKGEIYEINDLLIDVNNLEIDGNGAAFKTTNPESSAIFISSSSENILIKKLAFFGLADGTNDKPAGINILQKNAIGGRNSSSKNIEIKECTFLGGFVFSIIATCTTNLRIHECYGTGNRYVKHVNAGGYFILLQSCYDVKIYNNKAKATQTDRHAIYVSCDQTLTGDQRNEDIYIYDNNFDWLEVGGITGFETCVTTRSTINLFIFRNIIKGGYGGIGMTPSNGHYDNVWITENSIYGQKAGAVHGRFGIGIAESDRSESFKVRTLRIFNNSIISDNPKVNGINASVCEDVIISDNTITAYGGRDITGIELKEALNVSLENNIIKGNPSAPIRTGIWITDALSKNITIGENIFTDVIYKIDNPFKIPTLKYKTKRSFVMSNSNGSGSGITYIDNEGIFLSYTSQSYGLDVLFKNNINVSEDVDLTFIRSNGGNANIKEIDKTANKIKINVVNETGTFLPFATNAYKIGLKV